ncbi:MAG: hypothetical protein IJB27_04460 [Clostridia bacterium]|nr:hypothetical protein [Clostridia bacterium]
MNTMQKRLWSIVCAVAMLCALLPTGLTATAQTEIWNGGTQPFASGDGTAENPYMIMNGAQLAYLGKWILDGKATVGAYYKIGADIYLNDTTNWELWGTADANGNPIAPKNVWTPIGKALEVGTARPFKGYLDGGGHTIYGVYCDYLTRSEQNGLFAAAWDSEITDLHVAESTVIGKSSVGGIAGSFIGTMTSCSFRGTAIGYERVGGLIGSVGSISRVEDCCNNGTVIGIEWNTSTASEGGIGGIVGASSDNVYNCTNLGYVYSQNAACSYVGGIVGKNSSCLAKNCKNRGYVSGYAYVGGISGSGTNIRYSYNSGLVEGYSDVGGIVGSGGAYHSYQVGVVSGVKYVGGIVGRANATQKIENCYNTGIVTGEICVGGLAGSWQSEWHIKNSYNAGTVMGVLIEKENANNIGGLAGSARSPSHVVNCYNVGEVYCEAGTGITPTFNTIYSSSEGNSYYVDTGSDTKYFGTKITAEEATTLSTYVGFDKKIWTIGVAKSGYPAPTLIDVPHREPLLGNMDDNDTVNGMDALLLYAYTSGETELPVSSVLLMNVNGDDDINTLDALLLYKAISGE